MNIIGKIVLCGGIGVFFLHYTNRMVNSAKLFWIVFSNKYYNKQKITNSEPAAIEGDIIVNEQAYAADRTVDHTTSAIGAYLWRSTFKDNINEIDFKNRELKESGVTFACGMEFGRFSVVSNNKEVRVDPTWLDTKGTQLSELTVSGIHSHIKISIPLWESPTVHLTSTKTRQPLDQLSDLINAGDTNGLDRYHFESKPILDETTIVVCGNVRIERDGPVIYGTDTLPLLISDLGLDGLRKYLRTKTVKHGLLSVFFLVLMTSTWLYL